MENDTIPNPVEVAPVDANANPEETNNGTVTETTEENPVVEAVPTIDYEKKFSESSRGAQKLLEEKKTLEAELERLRQNDSNENLYPGFENLGEDERNNLIAYTNSVKKSVKDELYKDPSIAFAKQSYNEKRWDDAFSKTSSEFPQLDKQEFKSKYFKADNVPTNIDSILKDLAKIHLFDKAKDLGAEEEKQRGNRIELDASSGGDKTPPTKRSLDDWAKLAGENPQKFAKQSKEFNEDMQSGKLKA